MVANMCIEIPTFFLVVWLGKFALSALVILMPKEALENSV